MESIISKVGIEEKDLESVLETLKENRSFEYGSSSRLNEALIEGAVRLMSQVYLYDFSNLPYFPSAYLPSRKSSLLSKFTYHSSNPSWMFFHIQEGENILWDCKKKGIVSKVELGKHLVNPYKRVVMTDCSGFLGGLLSYAFNAKKITPNFVGFRAGEVVPKSYMIADNGHYVFEVSLADAQSGDILGHSKQLSGGGDGHVMLIGAITKKLDREIFGGFDLIATVFSVGYSHTKDCREKSGIRGIGCGYIGLRENSNNILLPTFFGKLTPLSGKGSKGIAKPVKILRILEKGENNEFQQYLIYKKPDFQEAFIGIIPLFPRYDKNQNNSDDRKQEFVIQYRLYNHKNGKVIPDPSKWWRITHEDVHTILENGLENAPLKVKEYFKEEKLQEKVKEAEEEIEGEQEEEEKEEDDEEEVIKERGTKKNEDVMIQISAADWNIKKGNSEEVSKPKEKHGTFSIGERKGWMYSPDLFKNVEGGLRGILVNLLKIMEKRKKYQQQDS